MSFRIDDLPRRVADKISDQPNGCWEWIANRTYRGYGMLYWNGEQSRMAHRVVYTLLVGPIEEETIDHLCRNTSCVNPNHLEPVSMVENILRGNGWAARNARKTHCNRGHPFDDANTRMYNGKRICRACELQWSRIRRAKEKRGSS